MVNQDYSGSQQPDQDAPSDQWASGEQPYNLQDPYVQQGSPSDFIQDTLEQGVQQVDLDQPDPSIQQADPDQQDQWAQQQDDLDQDQDQYGQNMDPSQVLTQQGSQMDL